MTISRFVPFRSPLQDVALLQNRLNSIFQDFTRTDAPDSPSESLAAGGFIPAVDIFEDNQRVMLKLEVPGIQQNDLDLRVENNTLTIHGERKFEGIEKEENYHRIERRFGSFARSFTLPQTVNTEAVQASYDAGVLTVSIPKKAEAKPRQVKIEVTSANHAPRQVEATSDRATPVQNTQQPQASAA